MSSIVFEPEHRARREAEFLSTWKPLNLLNLYRLVLSGLFVVLIHSDAGPRLLGHYAPELFRVTSIGYFALSLLAGLAIGRRWFPFKVQVYTLVLIDITAITLLMHASGGITSGLGMLLVINIAAGSLLMDLRMALMFASVAALAILGEELYNNLNKTIPDTNYTNAGILGGTVLLTAMVAGLLARRVVESEALARQRGVDIANLEQLNAYIIRHMQTGILVVDHSGLTRLINESAWQLLSMPTHVTGRPLAEFSPGLAERWEEWRKDPDTDPGTFRSSATSPEILPRFARLGDGNAAGTLIFLEDTASTAQRAQQLKLASLGRLTASIAHEIRNPLGAISHASQLLNESPALGREDVRLTQIIHNHSQRMNAIIENVMQLSRRDRARPELFRLAPWLKTFVEEFIHSSGIDPGALVAKVEPETLEVRMDTSQLHQVLWNLCHNAMRHSGDYRGMPKVELYATMSPEHTTPHLDVVDHGPGVAADAVSQIFEPFFTTGGRGVGLGLYIARELCEGNQARLDYIPIQGKGACFRITFADPRRRQIHMA